MKQISKKQDFLILRGCILHKEELTFTDKLLLSKLIELWINCETVNISNKKLSQLLGIGKTSIKTSNKKLKELGLISTNEEFSDDGDRTSNTYILNEARINDFLDTELFEIADNQKQNNSNEVEESGNTNEVEILDRFGDLRLARNKGRFYVIKEDGSYERLKGIGDFFVFGSNGDKIYNDCIINRIYDKR